MFMVAHLEKDWDTGLAEDPPGPPSVFFARFSMKIEENFCLFNFYFFMAPGSPVPDAG